MPSQNTSLTIPANTIKYRKWHGTQSNPNRCSSIMTVDNPVVLGTYSALSRTLSRTWVRTVPWPVPAGQLAPVNPYSVVRTEARSPKAHSYTEKPDNYPLTCYERIDTYGDLGYLTSGGCNAAAPAIDAKRVAWCQGRAMLNFLLKVKDQKSQIMVTLAERRQTVNMIASMARDLAGIRRKFLRRIPKKNRSDARHLHNSWLEYRYGWMPLYYDAYGIAKHLYDLGTFKEQYPVRAFSSWDAETKTSTFYPGVTWKGNVLRREVHRYKAGVGGFITVVCRVDKELVRAGLTNPLELAWEVLPYSFVVDWFVNIGGYIEGMTALNGVNLNACWQSTHTDRATAMSVQSNAPNYPIVDIGIQNVARQDEYNRSTVSPSLLQVGLTDLMDFNLQKQSWKHWVDSAALLVAAFRER